MSKTPEPQPNPYLMPQGAYPLYMQQPSHHSDEIDLFELIGTLWRKKLIIIAVMCVTTLLAGAYAFTAKEQWTAKAYLQAPRIADMGNYLDLRRTYERILDNNVDTGKLAERLFSDLMLLAQSPDEKIAFLKQSDYFKQLEPTLSTP
ncbi:MAG: Wzz/FepE/Etk N-terminal domain-containing protein, partial [Plesiomonas sp.]